MNTKEDTQWPSLPQSLEWKLAGRKRRSNLTLTTYLPLLTDFP
jgi:hypothetical protein